LEIKLREMTYGDVYDIYEANIGNVKKYFYDFGDLESAKSWVRLAMKDVRCNIKREYCVEVDGKFAGLFGFWLDGGDSTEVSLWLSPCFQNKGVAKHALQLLEEVILQWGIFCINYMADSENAISQKLALSCGYIPMHLDAITNANFFYKELGNTTR